MDALVPKKIVWAVDAFEEMGKPQQFAAEAVRCLQERCNATVHPVHILSPAELNLSAEFVGPWVDEYVPAARMAMERLLRDMQLENIEPPVTLTQSAASTAKAADLLIRHAKSLGADFILVGTHGRSGMSRLLLGSFAETLLLRSPVPVMVVGPHMKSVCDFSHVLFPTEFGDLGKRMFKRVVSLSRDFGSRITLYHAIPRPIEPVYQSGVYLLGSPWIPVHEYYTQEVARHERHAAGWAQWAKNQGVETDVLVDTEAVNIAESIMEQVKKRKVGWVAMAAHNGPIASALLGSVTRQLIRIAECPIWILRVTKESRKAMSRIEGSSKAA